MAYIMVFVFVAGYVAIAMEHSIRINKTASALLIGMICWAIYAIWPAEHLKIDTDRTVFELATDPELKERNPGLSTFMAHEEEEYREEVFKNPELYMDALKIPAEQTPHYVQEYVEHGLGHHIFDIAGILLFLLGAMTIVELMDAHSAFEVITSKIQAVNKVKLLWVVALVTFFLSAALDNLTTAIVMISVIRKLVSDKETRWIFGGFVVIAANSGGAWSPIGDVTTTMLWNNGQLPDSMPLISNVFLPAFASLTVPLIIASLFMRGNVERPAKADHNKPGHEISSVTQFERNLIFALGVGALMFVPVFKTITHLPPFTGMMMSLGLIWLISELMHSRKSEEKKKGLSVISVLQKIDTSSVLFFLGILMAVAALQEVGHLNSAAYFLDQTLGGNMYAINISIGILSAIVDNVPLVAAAQGMYPVSTGDFAANGAFWQFLAYCAGTGGSILIIGSAAGVAVMGLEKISFGWYIKRMTGYAFAGYAAGAAVFYFTSHV
ncbi:MAG: sodium:proton antiporter NhaD [Bacteroidetes bacterium]|nr:sodium:proton antiporter NhaD [Bacteroidota bacterium]